MGFRNTAAAPGLAYDQPLTMFNQTSFTGNASTSIGPFDVGQYQTILAIFFRDVASHTTTLTFAWQTNPGGVLISGDTFQFVGTDATFIEQPLPIRGNQLSVTVTEGAGAGSWNDQLIIVGSNRPYEDMAKNLNANRVLLSGTNAALGAGASQTFTPNGLRYDGTAALYSRVVGGGAATGIDVTFNDLFTGISTDMIFGGFLINGVSHATVRVPIVIPRNSWSVTVTQLAAVAQQADIEILCSPEGI